ncbi:MAG: cation:proton antiporter, partial [Gammaproteobacteria bacterium]|nr:cation:proton antiporter [Gammaproteobacteria bacterium]
MESDPVTFSFFLIFVTAAVLSTFALYTRQPLIVTYILSGVLLGPYVTGLVSDTALISSISHIGIIFLLFLLGLDMQPSKLVRVFKNALLVGIASCAIFFVMGFLVAYSLQFSLQESLIIGSALMFSSTIIGIKLLPTTVLHHRHTGELVVALLLIQDLLAILVLLVLTGGLLDISDTTRLLRIILALPLLAAASWVMVRFILLKLLARFDVFHEYIFLVAVGWCLGVAEVAHLMGLS